MKNTIKEFYNMNWKDYDIHMRSTGHYFAQKQILSKLNKEIKSPILDLACGTGYLLSLLVKDHKKVFGNDFSKKTIIETRKKLPDIPCTINNAETLKSYKLQFNTIISCNLFYYIKNYTKAIKRWKQLLADNGKIILIEEYPFINTNINRNKQQSKQLLSIIKPKSINEIKQIMKNSNLNLVYQTKSKIDSEHDLYGLIFEKKG